MTSTSHTLFYILDSTSPMDDQRLLVSQVDFDLLHYRTEDEPAQDGQ